MGSKDFFRELDKQKRLVDTFKQALLKEDPGRLRGLQRDAGMDVLLKSFMCFGNMAYRSGNCVVFEYFLDALFEVADTEPERDYMVRLLDAIPGFSLRAIRERDPHTFSAVVGAITNSVYRLDEVEIIGRRVNILGDLMLKVANMGLRSWAVEVVEAFHTLDSYFGEQGLGVSRVSLRNTVVSLVHSLPEGPLKEEVAIIVEGILSCAGDEPPEGIEAAGEAPVSI
ncbi:MAG: hypothetical protein PVJ38_06980 [Candidatus Bathyarchaeota archaeon]